MGGNERRGQDLPEVTSTATAGKDTFVAISATDFSRLVAGIEALARNAAPAGNTEELKALIKGVTDIAESNKVKFEKIPVHLAKFPTPWNPSGERRTVRLTAPNLFQNGARLNPVMLNEEEITLANQLKPGLYNHKKWQVVKRRDGSMDVRYPNAALEDRFEIKGQAGNFAGILKMIITEQESQAQRRRAGEEIYDE